MLAIFRIRTIVFIAIFSLFTADSNALLLGEKAKQAPKRTLKTALTLSKHGESLNHIWRTTKWYCPTRKRSECRWELPKHCIRPELINLIALQHTSFTGGVPLIRVFNASCVWAQYPQIRDKIRIQQGHCNGNLGFAKHNGEICINLKLLKNDYQDTLYIHKVILHEIQHQIQFIERWPRYSNKCPYQKRAMEAEAFYIAERASWSRERRENEAPAWYRRGLC